MQHSHFQHTFIKGLQALRSDNPFTHAIALTGGIATGKSTVGNLLKLHGFLIIDADNIAHKLLDEHSGQIASMFGSQFVQNGKVLRKDLGKVIFNDKEQKQKLEKFLHPLIKEEIIKEATIFESQKKPYFIDIPLFFETNNYPIEKSCVVYTTPELQLQRLIQRDNISMEEAQNKINNQMSIEEKKNLGIIIIDNTQNLKHLQNEVQRVVQEIKDAI